MVMQYGYQKSINMNRPDERSKRRKRKGGKNKDLLTIRVKYMEDRELG